MTEQQMRARVRYVIGPDGSPLTVADLPPKDTKRWVIRRKAEVVAAVRGGLLSIEEACDRYKLTVDEFLSWQRSIDKHGLPGPARDAHPGIPELSGRPSRLSMRRPAMCRFFALPPRRSGLGRRAPFLAAAFGVVRLLAGGFRRLGLPAAVAGFVQPIPPAAQRRTSFSMASARARPA